MSIERLKTTCINSQTKAKKLIVWLHGLGANGQDFVPLVSQLNLTDPKQYKWIFPHAPNIPISINRNMVMPAWYNIFGLALNTPEDEVNIMKSNHQLQYLIEQEMEAGFASEDIFIGGFSQGGAMALHLGLRFPYRLNGILALSGYLPLRHRLNADNHPINASTPIFLAHGQIDPVVPYLFGQLAYEQLKALQYPVAWHSYPIEHAISQDEIRDIRYFLEKTNT